MAKQAPSTGRYIHVAELCEDPMEEPQKKPRNMGKNSSALPYPPEWPSTHTHNTLLPSPLSPAKPTQKNKKNKNTQAKNTDKTCGQPHKKYTERNPTLTKNTGAQKLTHAYTHT
eukprot:c10622_g1_i1 orf=3-341(-)